MSATPSKISHAFGTEIDKDVVRRALAKHYRPRDSGTDGPSWLTFIGLIGTIRREYLDQVLFWNSLDLKRKLEEFRIYYNGSRVHQSLDGTTPEDRSGKPIPRLASLNSYGWQQHCGGLFVTPIAA